MAFPHCCSIAGEQELSQLHEKLHALQKEKQHLETTQTALDNELREMRRSYERLTKEYKSLLATTGGDNELRYKLEPTTELSGRLVEKQHTDGQGNGQESAVQATVAGQEATIAELRSEIVLLQDKLDTEAGGKLVAQEVISEQKVSRVVLLSVVC